MSTRSAVKAVAEVVMGCVSQVGFLNQKNVERTVVMSCKTLPETVPGTAVDRQCGSLQQAFRSAAQHGRWGTSQVPIEANIVDDLKAGQGQGNMFRYASAESHSAALGSNPAATKRDVTTRMSSEETSGVPSVFRKHSSAEHCSSEMF